MAVNDEKNGKRFLLIRHGKTQSNLERRYVGDPGEPLCEEGVREAEAFTRSQVFPPITALLSGGALRCRQTAEILFPGVIYAHCPLAEIDFGIFKGKRAEDLAGDETYKRWLETGCMGDIPGGDSVAGFKARCRSGFGHIAEMSSPGTTALVVHGGNIMAILEYYAQPKKGFYDYHVPNCGYYLCRYENRALVIERKGGGS